MRCVRDLLVEMSVKGQEEEESLRTTIQVSHLRKERGKEESLGTKSLRLQHSSKKVWSG